MQKGKRRLQAFEAWLSKAQRRIIGASLWLLFVISVLLMFKASDEPVIANLAGTRIEVWLWKFPTGNAVIFSIASGMLVSLLMYALVVWLPSWSRRRRVRNNLLNHYAQFKEQCIYNFLFSTDGSADPDVVHDLMDVHQFRSYFKKKDVSGTERWYAVMNGLQSDHIKAIAIEMGVLAEEVKFTLASIDVDDEEIFSFLKRLNRAIANLRELSPEDDIKYLTNFLWELFAAWSCVSGYENKDFVLERIQRI